MTKNPMTKKEKVEMEKHFKALHKANCFFAKMMWQYDDDNPNGGRLSMMKGPFSNAVDLLNDLDVIDFNELFYVFPK